MKMKKIAISMVLLFVAFFSALIIAGHVSSPEFHRATVQALDENISTVMKLTGASTAASAAVSMIPGDTATPIAQKLADFSTYFLAVLCVLYLEKYLVVLFGYIAFLVFIPCACFCLIAEQFVEMKSLRAWAVKLIAAGMMIFLMVPVSVAASSAINKVYKPSIDNTLIQAENVSTEIRDVVDEDEEGGLISGILGNVTEKVSLATEGAKKLIESYVDALAIMIVSSCLVPMVILLFMLWALKLLFNIRLPKFSDRRGDRGIAA